MLLLSVWFLIDNVVMAGPVQQMEQGLGLVVGKVVGVGPVPLPAVHVHYTDTHVEGRTEGDYVQVVALAVHRFHLLENVRKWNT